jgi:hypothetical protein
MLMFLMGPTGSGKSTAVMVAQQFCYEFCLAVGVMRSDTTFFYCVHRFSSILVWWRYNLKGRFLKSKQITESR